MTRSVRSARRGPISDTSFTRNLRYELADAEGRAIRNSWIAASLLGLLWLLLVRFLPAVPPAIALMRPEETGPVEVTVQDLSPPPTPEPAGAPAGRTVARPTAGGRGASDVREIGDAFGGASAAPGGGGMVGDVSNVLRGVEVSSGTGSTPGQGGGKAVIGYGLGGQGSRTPGRGGLGAGLGNAPGGGGLGGVGGGGNVGVATVEVAPPTVIRAERVGGPARNVADLGNYVRSRQSQLQFCYQEYGLKSNPTLAGTITVAVTLTGAGKVTGVEITNRTWSGTAASAAESCIRQRIMGWQFSPSGAGAAESGTYSFSFVFSK
jgi:hypothetical protein